MEQMLPDSQELALKLSYVTNPWVSINLQKKG